MNDFNAASVSDLVSSIKDLLEEQFQEVMVQGEVTNLSPSAAGHWYFTLSDEDASISVALFKGDALRNPLIRNLKNGDKIIVLGPISVYQKRGSFQLLAKRILPAGAGALKVQFERLKAKLSAEGLFDLDRKKAIPLFPKRIAVITAEHGAALQDFLNVLKRRSLWMDVLIVPAVVQGDNSSKSLVEALGKVRKIPDIEVVVLTRGGGSLEDLWSFNDELLVRSIADCPIPVISAVGHQVDFTLCDFAADFRAETPTAAAEKISQPQTELKARLTFCFSHLRSGLIQLNQQVKLLGHRFHPRELLNIVYEKVQIAQKRLAQIKLTDRGPELIGHLESAQKLDEYILRLTHCMDLHGQQRVERLKRFEQVLGALNPSRVLNRGYSYVTVKGGGVVSSHKDYQKLPSASTIELRFHDGTGQATKD